MHSGQQQGRRLAAMRRLGSLLCALGVALSGCASHVIQVLDLPPEAQAPPAENARTVDLSRLAPLTVTSERIDHGDILDVTISTGYENRYGDGRYRSGAQAYPVRVMDNGEAKIPLIGWVPVAGLELESAEQAIASLAVERGVFNNPHVTVMMRRRRVNLVTVIGAVEEQGVHELPRRSSWLLSAIVAAGGLSEDASAEVRIRIPSRSPRHSSTDNSVRQTGFEAPGDPNLQRSTNQTPSSGNRTIKVNLFDAARDGTDGYYLEDGAVVEIVRRDPRPISVLGLVGKQDKYDLPVGKDFHLLDALAVAGGISSPVANKIHIIRHIPTYPEPIVIEVGYSQAKTNDLANIRLAEGDVISVEQTSATIFHDAIRNFIRFGVSSTIPLF